MPNTSTNRIAEPFRNPTDNDHYSPLLKLKLRGLESQLTQALQNRIQSHVSHKDNYSTTEENLLNSAKLIENLLFAPSSEAYPQPDVSIYGENKEPGQNDSENYRKIIELALNNVEQKIKINLQDVLNELDLNWLQYNAEDQVSEIANKVNRVASNAEMIANSFARLESTIKSELISALQQPKNDGDKSLLTKRIDILFSDLIKETEKNYKEIIGIKKNSNYTLEYFKNNIFQTQNMVSEISKKVFGDLPKGVADIKSLVGAAEIKIEKIARDFGEFNETLSEIRLLQEQDKKVTLNSYREILNRLDELESKYEASNISRSINSSSAIKDIIIEVFDAKINPLESLLMALVSNQKEMGRTIISKLETLSNQTQSIQKENKILLDQALERNSRKKAGDLTSGIMNDPLPYLKVIEGALLDNKDIATKAISIDSRIDILAERVDEISRVIARIGIPRTEIAVINKNIANIPYELQKSIDPIKLNSENIYTCLKEIENTTRGNSALPSKSIKQIATSIQVTSQRLQGMDASLALISESIELLLEMTQKTLKREDTEKIVNAIKLVANKTAEASALHEQNYKDLLSSLANLVEDEETFENQNHHDLVVIDMEQSEVN